jgi:transcriptional regulator with XRE-family HTH domain
MTAHLDDLERLAMVDQKKFFMNLGTRLAVLRKEAGLTQAQLGRHVGLSQQMIADYESGTRQHIPLCRLISMADTLGIDLNTLLSESPESRRKRGPAPKIQQLVERIHRLPKTRQKFVEEMLANALQAH